MKRLSFVVCGIVIIALLMLSVTSFAQNAPGKITYQGVLKYLDAHFKVKYPKAGSYKLQFDFFSASSGGSSVLTIAPSTGIPVDKYGNYTYLFGDNGTDAGNLDLSMFANTMIWIQVTVVTSIDRHIAAGYVVPPGRIQFTTVPYAALSQHVADLPIKVAVLTGTTGANEGDYTTITHGLDASKILSIDVMIDAGGGQYVPAGHYIRDGFQLEYWYDGTYIYLNNTASNSWNIHSRSVKAFVTYQP